MFPSAFGTVDDDYRIQFRPKIAVTEFNILQDDVPVSDVLQCPECFGLTSCPGNLGLDQIAESLRRI